MSVENWKIALEIYKRTHSDLETVTIDKISLLIDCSELSDVTNIPFTKSTMAVMNAQKEKQLTAQIDTPCRARKLLFERHFWTIGLRKFPGSIKLNLMWMKTKIGLNTLWKSQHVLQSRLMHTKTLCHKTSLWNAAKRQEIFDHFAPTHSPVGEVLFHVSSTEKSKFRRKCEIADDLENWMDGS